MRRNERGTPFLAAALVVSLFLGGCAYFNTFYSAKRNFDKAERLYLNPDDRATAQQAQYYDKAILSAAKLVESYPRSKWLDDAVLITGRSLLGKSEFDKARKTFAELATKFPNSPLLDQALYYSAEAYRRERKYETSQQLYDSLRHTYPRSRLIPITSLREAQVELALLRPRDAVAALRSLNPSRLDDRGAYEWHHALANGYFAVPSYDSARVEYEWVSEHAKTPIAVHEAMLHQGDCLEGKRAYAEAADYYRRYEHSASAREYQDQASLRRASVLASSGKASEGLQLLQDIVNDKSRVGVAPEALFRIGFIQEVQLEDAAAARATYAKVQEQFRGSPFARQAEQRSSNLDKIDALRAAARSDTTGREQAAAAAFAVAERFLVDSDRPERALEEYGKVERDFSETQSAPKASFAAGWVFYRRIQRPASADSVWRHLVARYPQTVYGRAASALMRGQEDSLRTVETFGSTLVKYPFSPNATFYVPTETRVAAQRIKEMSPPARPDSLRGRPARPDTTAHQAARPDTTARNTPPAIPAPADSGGGKR